MNNNEKIKVPIHQSLTRPVLIAGGERELVLIIIFLGLTIWVAGMNLIAFIINIVLIPFGIICARVIAKDDPYRTKIFIRHVKHQDYYPATEKIENIKKEPKIFRI